MARDPLPPKLGDTLAQAQVSWQKLKSLFPLKLAHLAEEVLKQFLQLAVPGIRKIDWGTTTFKWAASRRSANVKITHSLGTEPVGVWFTGKAIPAAGQTAAFGWFNGTPATFEAYGNSTETSGTFEYSVTWIAIG